MLKEKNNYLAKINKYYSRRESRWGYKYLLRGTKHYGFYANGKRNGQSLAKAQRSMERRLGKELGLKPGSKILDAGCGEGLVAIHLNQDFGYSVWGIDVLKQSINTAVKNKKKAGITNAEFEVMDFSKLDYPDNFFDGLYTMETLVHSPDIAKTLKEFLRVLKPGGVIVNHEYSLADKMSLADERDWEIMFTECPMLDAYKNFRISNMEKIWENAGFFRVTADGITKEVTPFMKHLYLLAFVPFYILKLFRKESLYVNTFAGVRSYQMRALFQYTVMIAFKPKI